MTVMKGGYGNSGFPGNLAQGLVVTVNTAYDILLSGVQVLHGLKEQRALPELPLPVHPQAWTGCPETDHSR